MLDRVRAAALFREKVGDSKLIEGWIEGPCAEAADLRGINTLMIDFFDDPDFVRDLFEFTLQLGIRFARAQVEAGADFIGVGDAAASLIGPQFYQEFVWPYERRLVDELHALGTRVRLHICGNISPLLENIGKLGCDIVDLDFMVPVEQARRAMGDSQILLGNIDPVRALKNSSPEAITAAIAECHRQAGPKYIVGAGCEVPRNSPCQPPRIDGVCEDGAALSPPVEDARHAIPLTLQTDRSAKEELMLIDELLANVPVITDGAWGTQLQARGLPGGTCPDHWNLTHPEVVQQVPTAYIEAGSQLVLTNTFRANRVALAGYGLADRAVEINRAGVEISRRAAGDRARVFASMGPSGKMLIAGEISPDELAAAFAEQAHALAQAGAEGIVVETMAELEEAELALHAAKQTGLPVVVCVVFDSGPLHDCTMMGVTPEQAAQRLAVMGADVVGANCGQGIEGYINICRRMRAVTHKPLWIKANAGLPDVVGGKVVYRTTANQFAAHARALLAAGAQFIGGCCGTSPEFIAALSKELNS